MEYAYNKRWQAIVKFGRWVTADESRVAGWYHSAMTVGPEPKPIRTGVTLHSLCVTHGPLKTFNLFVRAYVGVSDMDLDQVHQNVCNLRATLAGNSLWFSGISAPLMASVPLYESQLAH